MDNGPGAGPLCSKKAVIAVTGQIEDAVFPRNRSTPLQKGSVLLTLMRTLKRVGAEWLSNAMSASDR